MTVIAMAMRRYMEPVAMASRRLMAADASTSCMASDATRLSPFASDQLSRSVSGNRAKAQGHAKTFPRTN